nr:DUF262 domain-containing protein [Succinivibrionaceae bacterium]
MSSELMPFSEVFSNSLFRIPDFQRGYAWREEQLRDFWEDLVTIPEGRSHYTGMLSLKDISKAARQDIDISWLPSSFRAFHVIDGQQRLTTFVILVNEIVRFARGLPENEGLPESEIVIGSEYLSEIRKKYICRKRPPKEINVAYIFGYEDGNPSADFLRLQILGDGQGGEAGKSYYNNNLAFARDFFAARLAERCPAGQGLDDLYDRLTNRMMFNL